MADRSRRFGADAELEAALRGLADAIDWPAAGPGSAGGPDLATAVRVRIEAGEAPVSRGAPWPSRRWSGRRIGLALLAALIVVSVLAALAGAAGLGLPGLRLFLGEPSVSPPPSGAPATSPGPSGSAAGIVPGARMGLGRQVALEDLDSAAGFPVRWPADPAIGPPDSAWVDPEVGGQVSLVWRSRAGLPETLEPGVGLVLTAFRGAVDGGFFTKAVHLGTVVKLSEVDGTLAYWLTGDPHFFFYESATGQVQDPRRWIGDALIWADGPVTYRLETALGLDRTVEIAESVP